MKKQLIVILIATLIGYTSFAQQASTDTAAEIGRKVSAWMKEGAIPGLSLIIIKDNRQVIRNFGFADKEQRIPVTANTLFEIGSCSKAFTALAALNLEKEGRLVLDSSVQHYLPWLHMQYKGKEARVTVRQLLHHTSGIPWSTISKIPASGKRGALLQTVQQLAGQKLVNPPGKTYEYATINYDVVALLIQELAHQPFETYVMEKVIAPLQLQHTTIGAPASGEYKSPGYKTGFFKPRKYNAPVFRGNNAAGYVISNAVDMGRWVQFQLGMRENALYDLARSTHARDETVPLHNMAAYAMGWHVSLNGNGEIFHDGRNPNYTSYITFREKDRTAVIVLANSASGLTMMIGDRVMKMLHGEELPKEFDPSDGTDKVFSMLSIVLGLYVLLVLAFLVIIARDAVRGRRTFVGFSRKSLYSLVLLLLIFLPFLAGIYLLPKAITGFTWSALLVWSPVSLPVALALLAAAFAVSYVAYAAGLLYPDKNVFRSIAPRLVLLSVLSGLANMAIIVIITSSLGSNVAIKYLVFYYLLTMFVYLFGRRYVQTNLIRFSRDLTYELRIQLIDKMFSTSYQKFEKIDRGRVYTALNDDLNTIGESTNVFMTLVASIITATGAFVYLATIAFWSTMLTILLLLIIMGLYYSVSRKVNTYYEDARDARNVFIRLTNGMIDGFKEISLRRNKKLEYKQDVADCANEYKEKVSIAGTRFVDVNLVGESVLIISLGVVTFAFPKLFPGIPDYTIMNFIVILLYLIAPVNGILNSVPAVMQLRIAWNRIKTFMQDIPANLDLAVAPRLEQDVKSIKACGISFRYQNDAGTFTVGPIDLEARKGEILFIIGGNGSGKTTLAKMLTGLYEPDEGVLMINDRVVPPSRIGEYFSAVFSPCFLFEKLYDIDANSKSEEVRKYLELLKLEDKVNVAGNRYTTVELSGGQRKRLALLQCYLEDAPIYLFDEWAADQDPDYRYFFYRHLLPEMREKGKIIIAITHDDHYFDIADKVLKINQGQLEEYIIKPVTAAGVLNS